MRICTSLLALLLCLGCASAKKELSKGRYKEAIALSVAKLKGKKTKKPEYVFTLEEAHKFYLQKKLDEAAALERKGEAGGELQLLKIYEEIEAVQAGIRPLLPLTDKKGYRADIRLLDVSAELGHYRNQAADYLYASARENLEKGKKGDRNAARESYKALKEMERISGATSLITQLQGEAQALGTTHLLLLTEISPDISLSKNATEVFRNMGSEKPDKTWQTVHLTAEKGKKYDYEVILVLNDFVISPEKESTREYQDKKEIEEETGASSRDGKKITRKKEVTADVIELYQFKEAAVKGQLILYDLKTRKEIFTEEVNAVQTFENYASTYKGDKRALSDVSLKRIGGKPRAFPTNEQILADALVLLKKDMLARAGRQYATL